MYSFYVQRGHSLKELQELPVEEELFYMVSMELYYERLAQMLPLGEDDSPKEKVGEVSAINGN